MIQVEHLTKCYGDVMAVRDLSFEIDEGHVYGFLGPNGAGKSTTMNIMTGCLSATSGRVLIDGHDIFEEPKEAKRLMGYLPEQPPLYLGESPVEYLTFVGRAKGLKGEELKHQVTDVMAQTKIEHVAHRRIGDLSKGYRQRVGIAQALLGNPKVIILDEPTVGLDPIQIIEIRDLIRELGRTHTVIFSSHILSEVQAICDRILIIAHGKLVAFDCPENLERDLLTQNQITLTTQAGPDEVQEVLDRLDHLSDITFQAKEGGYTQTHFHTSHPKPYEMTRQLFWAFAESDVPLLEMTLKKASLEDVFLELTETAPAQEDEAEEMDEEVEEA
ncbi:ABC transporter ATP-binding protein [Pseudoflavonifractor sp. An85]|uniref:ABC transporter ATP-binding protein n=1 Tax=Pseudoflavonifractor sp. An85 TaxID=1965661 RepID=UPI000B384BBB|nr:ABC transporter ATP-binding protein [Pseudoflavonifractor sp. An85]OUN21969.1 ABC transporter [Pseudoflavonifractor sp. An85]